ncbi:hybrid sensor histidine kinase/response regulator [Plebeiibacterium marinum]|uniref:histidine kinase n=1 Tax=Plebeiibacterium marinum TaxID=2992111 RepID=A0AAE3MG14_9BACT|nr:hybrid sensor histidine kinase/response regulator [Plebeiobacterium marinum]MCW3807318.1 hybrid sensor histidine kinase/response regulator [Plebeiobacterium marinum]
MSKDNYNIMDELKSNILYVDDEIGNLVGFKTSFLQKYNVMTCENTIIAEKYLYNNEIEVLLIDYKMPIEDGISFAQRIECKFPNVIKILVTAHAESELAIKTINSHSFYAFVSKPWDYEQLKLIIQNAIDKYNLEKNNRELMISLQKALNNEKRANYVKDVFLRNISHEVRTPLNGIIGFSQLIIEEGNYPEINEKLDIILQSCNRLLYTMQSIIDSSIIIADQLEFSTSTFNLEHLLNAVIEEKSRMFNNTNRVEIQSDESNKLICTNDESKVKVIFEKLIDNAFKFSNTQRKIKIHINSLVNNNFFTIKITNNGAKIPKEDYDNIFESFLNGDNSLSRANEGIGLGLFIAKSYTEFLGGKIWIEESQDSSIFCVTLKKNI